MCLLHLSVILNRVTRGEGSTSSTSAAGRSFTRCRSLPVNIQANGGREARGGCARSVTILETIHLICCRCLAAPPRASRPPFACSLGALCRIAAWVRRMLPSGVVRVTILSVAVGLSGCRDRTATTQVTSPDNQHTNALPALPLPGETVAQPLAPRIGTGSPRFARLSAAETGIDFTNRVDPEHPMRRLYHSGFVCGGVAVGDVDGDGLPDIFLSGAAQPNRLYRQVGDMRFEDVTAYAGIQDGGHWGTGVTMVDIDNDGDLDIYVCNYDAPNQLYVNQGSGRFVERAEEWYLDIVESSMMVAMCDYDLDGDLDLYLLTNRFYRPDGRPREPPVAMDKNGVPYVRPEYERFYALREITPDRFGIDDYGRPDYLFCNNGDGTFSDVTETSGIRGHGYGLSATWWDYNEDGLPDIFVCNDFDDPDYLYRNNGDGTFTDQLLETMPHTSWFSMGSDVGDINNDGLFDFISVDMSATSHYKQKTTMGVMNAEEIAAVAGPPPQYMRNALLINSGAGRFWEAGYLAGVADTDWSWAAKFADFDNDGWIDLFVSNGMIRSFNDSDIPFDQSMMIGRTKWDIYKDAPPRPEQNLVFRNDRNLGFQDVSRNWGLDHVGMSYGTALSDLDRDGDLDLIVVNVGEPVGIYRNDGDEGHRLVVHLRGTKSNRFGLGALVRVRTAESQQMRQMNPMTGYLSCNEPIVHFGLGADIAVDELTIDWPSGFQQTLRDVKADQRLVVCEPETGEVKVVEPEPRTTFFQQIDALATVVHEERAYDDFARQPLLPNKLSQLGPGMAWGDVDQDGDADLFVGGAAGAAGKLAINQGQGRFELLHGETFAADAQCEDMGVLFADFDADGDLDLYVVSGGVECEPGDALLRDRLYINDGKGKFDRAAADALPDVTDSGGSVCAADFDRDGDLDLFVGGRSIPGKYPLSPHSRLLENRAGRFLDVTDQCAPDLAETGLVTSSLWSDINDDGWLDLVVAHEWGPVKTFLNVEGRLVDRTTKSMAALTGWWNGLDACDVDGDGDIDLVATNFGLNTKYHASHEKPTLLYYGDFEKNGRMRLVEAEFEDETLFPIRGKSCSTRAMPSLGGKFTTYRDFALADLQQLYTDQCLDTAHRFAATTLESAVLLNDGSGQFEQRPLPRLAQIAPGFGVQFTEVNGDSHPDLYLVQNFYGPQVETGRMDGGLSLLMTGNGDGSFTPVGPRESGFLLPLDAKSLTSADVDGDRWPDFAIGINDNAVRTFARRQKFVYSLCTVGLSGLPGNPTAVGARVTIRLSDGRSQTDEVRAGDGYLSQSTPTLLFGCRGAQVAAIDVRWPDGFSSRHEGVVDQQHYQIQHPRSQ